jgi:endonuclease G
MKPLFKSTLLAVLMSTQLMAQAADPDKVCPQFFYGGTPVHQIMKVNQDSKFVCKKAYSLQFYAGTKTPLWVAERLTAEATRGEEERTNKFLEDPEIPSKFRTSNRDFKDLNARAKGRGETFFYDRGHMAPAGDFSNDAEAMAESFYLSNMIPQVDSHNQGIWKDLEIQVRQWARGRGVLFVLTGPVFRDGKAIESLNGLAVPTDVYKIVVDPSTKEMLAYVIPNLPFKYAETKEKKGAFGRQYVFANQVYRLVDFQKTVREVEVLTNLDFHPFLNPSEAQVLENKRIPAWK